MTADDKADRRDLRLVMWSGSVATALFLIVSTVTTQVASVRGALPFTDDPYDAVVSFGVVGIAVVGFATLARAIGGSRRPYDPSVARRMAIGVAIATVIVAIATVSDIVAVIAAPVDVTAPGINVILVLLGLTAGMTVLALASIGRARSALIRAPAMADGEPDVLDELGLIIDSVGAGRIAERVTTWVELSPVSPRRHRVLVGLLGGATTGLAAVAWHAVREGPWASPVAAALFGLLMAVGVAGAYLICLVPLRLVRRPRADRRRGPRPI